MSSIEKWTLPVGKIGVIITIVSSALVTLFTSYYGTKTAIDHNKYETDLKIQALEYADKMIWQELTNNKSELEASRQETRNTTSAIMSYIGTGLRPEDIKRKREGE